MTDAIKDILAMCLPDGAPKAVQARRHPCSKCGAESISWVADNGHICWGPMCARCTWDDFQAKIDRRSREIGPLEDPNLLNRDRDARTVAHAQLAREVERFKAGAKRWRKSLGEPAPAASAESFGEWLEQHGVHPTGPTLADGDIEKRRQEQLEAIARFGT